jgi:hypothetical protein
MILNQLSRRHFAVAGAVLCAGLAGTAVRQSAQADGPPPPPPEAYAACESKATGDACAVQIRDTQVHGTCDADRTTGKLFCRPAGPPPAPPEAFDPYNDP